GQQHGEELSIQAGHLREAPAGEGRLPAPLPLGSPRGGRHLPTGDGSSRPGSRPPRPCAGRTTSTARTRATTRRGCTTRSTSSAAMRPTATTPCRCTRRRVTVAFGIRSPSRSTSTTGSTWGTPSTSTDSGHHDALSERRRSPRDLSGAAAYGRDLKAKPSFWIDEGL